MTVAVVVPTFNRASLLPFTLDRILSQTRAPDEIIVVDDGSTDDTPALLSRYAPIVRHLRIANSGDLAARNVGVRATNCTRVAFCDSDDLWMPEFLATMDTLWQAAPVIRAAYANFVIVRDDVWHRETKFDSAPPDYWRELRRLDASSMGVFDQNIVEKLIRFQPFFASAVVVDREFFLDIGGWDENVGRGVGTDFGTALRIAEYPPIGIVFRPLVGIRKHSGNYSADTEQMNLGDSNILEYVLETRPAVAAAHGPLIRASIARRRRDALDSAFARRDWKAVKSIYALLGPAERPWQTRIKHHVSILPAPLSRAATDLLLALGSARTRTLTRAAASPQNNLYEPPHPARR